MTLADQPRLGTNKDPLAFEPNDGYMAPGGFVNRDAAECGLPTGSPNCQDWNRNAGTAGRSADLVGIAALTGDDFKVADNFTVTASQTLTNICFWGFYGSTTGPVAGASPAAGAEAFRIRVYSNAGSPSFGLPATILKQWTVGANAGYGLVVDPNTSLVRSPAGTPRAGVFSWRVALTGAAQLALAPGCYWLEISGATNGIVEGNRLRWAVVNAASPANDGVVFQALESGPYAFTDLIGGPTASTDQAFCLNFALATNNCNILPAAVNNSCANAQTVTAPFSASNLNTLRSLTPIAPFCGANPVNGNTLWYKVVGNGQTFTASTCGPNTGFDTVINVYCGSCSGLNCVANNDTGPATCTGGTGGDPSQVSFATNSTDSYYIAIFGFELDAGFLDVSVTSAAGTAAPACASDRCALSVAGVTPAEVDPCFTNVAPNISNNSACNGSTVGSFTFGDDFAGNVANVGTNRDFDFWELQSPIPDTVGDGTAFLDVTYTIEFPGVFNFFTGPCTAASNGTFLGGNFINYRDGGPACPRTPSTVQVNTPAGQPFRLNILPVDFGGVPCGSGNNYIITVTLSTLGACCVPAQACFLDVRSDCEDPTVGGVYRGNSTTCTPVDSCTAPVNGACCSGSTCSATTMAACIGANTAYKGNNSVCGAGLTFAGCCKADYNQSGSVTVQDIFDFLSGYFTGNPQANINGAGGVTVQDIFDFLSAYFTGCT